MPTAPRSIPRRGSTSVAFTRDGCLRLLHRRSPPTVSVGIVCFVSPVGVPIGYDSPSAQNRLHHRGYPSCGVTDAINLRCQRISAKALDPTVEADRGDQFTCPVGDRRGHYCHPSR